MFVGLTIFVRTCLMSFESFQKWLGVPLDEPDFSLAVGPLKFPHDSYGPLAQLVERLAGSQKVVGSRPSRSTKT